MKTLHIVLSVVYGLSATLAEQVCSPDTCVKGSSSSPILAHDGSTHKYFTPGTFQLETMDLEDAGTPSSKTNQSITHESGRIIVSPPPQPLLLSGINYLGEFRLATDWKSVYLPLGWYGVITPGKALWGSIPDSAQLPGNLQSTDLLCTALSTCDPPCASGGICTTSNSSATCVCDLGWTGAACDTCEKGFYGNSCTACPGDCSICDDGLSGTGKCLGTSSTPLKDCNCEHGTCESSGDCVCAAGYRTNSKSSSSSSSATKCSECTQGFYKDHDQNCLACPLGCASCILVEGSNDTATCTSCLSTLSLSTSNPATCGTTGSCSDGQFFDSSTSTCQSCSPACTTCTGPSTSECLSCATPRVNLQGSCVGFDPTTGVCDSSLSGLQGVFVVNNEKQRCDACPAGCLDCTLPNYSSGTAYSDAQCKACQDGYLLQSGKCVEVCSEGFFLPEGAGKNGTCQRCDASCTACVGTANSCTICPSPNFASNGQCTNACPSNTFATNGTCVPCSSDCATCSGSSSSSSCLSCPPSRPVLSNGRCLDHCPSNQYHDPTNAISICKDCDTTCGACSGPSSSECTTCPDGSKLSKGSCRSANCKSGVVAGLGVCLEDLVDSKNKRNWLTIIILPFALALLGWGFWWYVRRERKKTHAATKEFGDKLDERDIRDRMMILRLEKVLGLDRVRLDPSLESGAANVEAGGKARDRNRLKELWLLSKKTRKSSNSSTKRNSEGKTKEGGKAEEVEMGDTKGWEQRESHWFVPPPPYVSSEASGSTSTIDTLSLQHQHLHLHTSQEGNGDSSSSRPQTKVISMSSPTVASDPEYTPRQLKPPRRPPMKIPLGFGPNDGKELDRRTSLLRLWPNLPVSPGFGGTPTEEEDRELGHRMGHGLI